MGQPAFPKDRVLKNFRIFTKDSWAWVVNAKGQEVPLSKKWLDVTKKLPTVKSRSSHGRRNGNGVERLAAASRSTTPPASRGRWRDGVRKHPRGASMSVTAVVVFSQTSLRFVLLGMATGALYAVVALGVVLTYRASGVLNFSTGAFGAIAAFFFYSLRDDHGVAPVIALVLALALGAGIGALTQFVVMTVLRRVSLLAKLIATLGLMTFAQGFISVIWGIEPKGQPDSILPTHIIRFTSELVIPEDRVILIGIAIVVALLLRFTYSKTMFGLATSAVAESRRVAATSGWSPTNVELINFMVAGTMSAGAAILLAPIIGLDAAVLTFTVLPALAAALVGRFSSFAVTVAAALAIGIITAELQLFQPDIAGIVGWQPTSLAGLPDVVPLLIIVFATALSGRARLQRGDVTASLPLPGSGRVPIGLLVIGTAVSMYVVLNVSAVWDDAFITTFATAILVLSVVVVTGFCGQLSLCQFALAGFGAWVAARLVATQGFPFEVALLAGMAASIPLGLLVALPALRTRGVNLAVATLALSLVISAVIFQNGSLTGGFIGTVVTSPHVFGLNIDPIVHPDRYAAFVLVAFVIAGLVVANVRRGRAGRRLLAVRANERAAASLGVGVYGAKLYAFGLSSAIAALSGTLLAFTNPNIQFTSFDVSGSISAVLYAVVGGIGWASGALLGALQAPGAVPSKLITDLFSGISNLTSWLLIFAGLAVVVIFTVAPDGLASLQSRQWQAMTRRFRRTRTPAKVTLAPARVRRAATLDISGITVRFGGVVALDDVGFRVSPGEIVGLIGPNGAGKTTLLDVVTGFTKQHEGSVSLDGQSIDKWSPEKRAREGLARSWQAVELFEEMTVRENLLVGTDRKRFLPYLTDLVHPGRESPTAVMNEMVTEFGLADHLDDRPSELSQGVARLAGIGRAMVTEPTILLLDEPAAGLDSGESEELGVVVRDLVRRTGIGVLIVEHDVNLLLNICDRIVVLDFGKKIADATPAEIAKDPAVIAAYLGAAPEEITTAPGSVIA